MKTEEQMRDMQVPWPKTAEELVAFIEDIAKEGDDYGKAVYVMSLAATAAFYYASHVVGASGAQAGFAALDTLRRVNSIDGPFIVLRAGDMVYPQYDLHGSLEKFMQESMPWVREQARKHLHNDGRPVVAVPDVIAHWQRLVDGD